MTLENHTMSTKYTVDAVKSAVAGVAPHATIRALKSGAIQICHPQSGEKGSDELDRTQRFRELRDASIALDKAGLEYTYQSTFNRNGENVEFPALFVQEARTQQSRGGVDKEEVAKIVAETVMAAFKQLGLVPQVQAPPAQTETAPPTPPASGSADY